MNIIELPNSAPPPEGCVLLSRTGEGRTFYRPNDEALKSLVVDAVGYWPEDARITAGGLVQIGRGNRKRGGNGRRFELTAEGLAALKKFLPKPSKA